MNHSIFGEPILVPHRSAPHGVSEISDAMIFPARSRCFPAQEIIGVPNHLARSSRSHRENHS
jgi:hypothetical protein